MEVELVATVVKRPTNEKCQKSLEHPSDRRNRLAHRSNLACDEAISTIECDIIKQILRMQILFAEGVIEPSDF